MVGVLEAEPRKVRRSLGEVFSIPRLGRGVSAFGNDERMNWSSSGF
jgi:hypothetical protein